MNFLMKNEYNHMYENEHAEFQKQILCDEAAMKKQCKKMALKCMKTQELAPKPRFTMKQ